MNDVLQKQQNKPFTPIITVPKKKIFLVLPYLGLQSKIASKQISRGQMAKIVCRAACDCNDFYIGKTKRRLHDRKAEHFKALINGHHRSALADHVTFNRGTQRQFSENICSEDDLRSRIFGTFVLNFFACLPLLRFSNI